MKVMDGRVFLTGVLLVSVLFSCEDKEEGGNNSQNHDNNKMMSVLHAMNKSLDSLTMTLDPDNDFAMMIRVHHKGAINMGNLELSEGTDQKIRQMATAMIARRKEEIQRLDSFLLAHPRSKNEPRFHQEAEKSMERMNNNADLQVLTGNTDHDFAILMIQHHQGALDMADLEIRYGESDGLKQMALKMKEDQQKEIKDLQEWLLGI